MANIQDYSEGALLSSAAYASLILSSEKKSKPLNKRALRESGLTPSQSSDLLKRYEISYIYTNDKKGLSFVVFRSIEKDKYTIAIRGTDCLPDIISNGEIVIGNTLARSQVLRLANQLEILFTPKGQRVTKYKKMDSAIVKKLSKLIGIAGENEGEADNAKVLESGAKLNIGFTKEEINNEAQGMLYGENFNIVGHSLGGHLAVAAQQILGKTDVEVYTYNAPGINVHDPLLNALRCGKDVVPPDNITNLHGEGIGVIAGFKGWYGKSCEVFTETLSHGIQRLANSLRVMSLFEKIDSRCKQYSSFEDIDERIKGYNKILKNAHLNDKLCLHVTVGLLYEAMGGVDYKKFYKSIVKIEKAIAKLEQRNINVECVASNISGWSLDDVKKSPERLYALMTGAPFVLNGMDFPIMRDDDGIKIHSDEYIEERVKYMKNFLGVENAKQRFVPGVKTNASSSILDFKLAITMNKVFTKTKN